MNLPREALAPARLGGETHVLEPSKALPILFSPAMVRAEHAGRKSQTRRVIKPQPDDAEGVMWRELPQRPGFFALCREELGRGAPEAIAPAIRCPYGTAGTLLWVRERMRVIELRGGGIRVRYEADDAESDWIEWPERLRGTPRVGHCLPYGGFREASRSVLEVRRVRVERLHAITEKDAKAEGMPERALPNDARDWFRGLWESINGKRAGCSWADNPWVWVVDFDRFRPQREAA